MLPSNPLNAYKTVYKEIQQVYLDASELDLVRKAVLIRQKHQVARDLFLFQANTGLAYTDLVSLEWKDISELEGRHWIIKARQKTEIIATIPILAEAKTLIDKYSNSKKEGPIFPTVSIQKYNQYLGEIGVIAALKHKKLSSHVGRRTFGQVALEKGISINVISKILGHSNTIITQRMYAITTAINSL